MNLLTLRVGGMFRGKKRICWTLFLSGIGGDRFNIGRWRLRKDVDAAYRHIRRIMEQVPLQEPLVAKLRAAVTSAMEAFPSTYMDPETDPGANES